MDGVTEQHYTAARVMMWGGTLVLTAVVVLPAALCLARAAVRRVYQLAVADLGTLPPAEPPEFYLRHRTGDLIARAT